MNQTVGVKRREELLDGVLDELLRNGVGDATLRPLASALDVSTFTLTYHFGDKEQLVDAALERAAERQRALVAQVVATLRGRSTQWAFSDAVPELWLVMATGAGFDLMRFAFEVCALAMRRPERFGEYATRLTVEWVDGIERALVVGGWSRHDACARATTINATFNGLLLDLLVTNDRPRLETAARMFADDLAEQTNQPRRP